MMGVIHGKEQRICQRILIEKTYQLWAHPAQIQKYLKMMEHQPMERLFLWMSLLYGTRSFGLGLMMEMFKSLKMKEEIGPK